MSVSQTLTRQQIRFTAGKGPLDSRVAQLLQIIRISHQVGSNTKQQVRRELLRMGPSDQSPSLMHILSRLAYTRHIRQLCLLQGTDEPLSPRHPVQHVAILQIAPVAEATVIGRRDHQVLARIDGPKKTFLEVRAKTIIVPDIGNEEPRTSLGERIGQRGNRDYPDIVRAKTIGRSGDRQEAGRK